MVLSLQDNTLTEGYVVGIRSSEASINECAGVLIARKYVLSANCKPNWTFMNQGILNLGASSTKADKQYASIASDYNSGKHKVSEKGAGELIKIVNWVRHPDYNAKTGEFNYFIFTLETKSKYTPVTVPATGFSVSAGSSAIATGFTKEKLVARKNVTILTSSDCSKTQQIYGSEFCALTANASDACGLSVGSPVVVTTTFYPRVDTLLGVVNTNNGCNKAGVPIVFNQVAKIRNWIKTIANV